jgi:aldose 1-epimerase
MKPSYAVDTVIRDGVEVFRLRQGDDAVAEVAPALGNNCFAFHAGLPVLEPVEFAEFLKKPTSYGIPLLFPFPNRVRDGVFTFQGRSYPVDPPRHGFVRDKAWNVLARGASAEEGAWIRSTINAEDHEAKILRQFPFPFTLEATWRVREGALHLEVEARNQGALPMPAGFGIHPYFRRPARGTITVPASRRWELEEALPTGNVVNVDPRFDLREPRDIEGLVLDDIYTGLRAEEDGLTRCHLDDAVARVRTTVEFSREQFPHVVVYTPPAPRPALCIEPNTCPTDAFNLQARGVDADVIVVKPSGKASFSVRIYSGPR